MREAAALSPADAESRLELMTLYEQSNDYHQALAVCEQLRTLDPENTDYVMNFGVLCARLGQFDAALEALRQAIERDPDNRQYREAYQLLQEQN